MDFAPLVEVRCSVHGRTDKRMTKHDTGVESHETAGLGTVRGRLGNSEPVGGAPLERRVTGRVGRCDEEEAPRVAW